MLRLLLIPTLLLLTACGPSSAQPREDANPAPSASSTIHEAQGNAAVWSALKPGRTYMRTASSGSMVPYLDSRSVLLLEPATAADLRPGDVGLYDDLRGGLTVHRVKEVRPDAVYFSGDNNRESDGWISAERVRWRVAGILYSNR